MPPSDTVTVSAARGSRQGHGVVGIDHALADDGSGDIRVSRVIVGYSVVTGLVDENFGVALRLNVLRVVSVDGISGDGRVACQEGLDAGAAVAVDRVVLTSISLV